MKSVASLLTFLLSVPVGLLIGCGTYRFEPPDKYPLACGPAAREWRLLVRDGLAWKHVGDAELAWREWNTGVSFNGHDGEVKVAVKHWQRGWLTLYVEDVRSGDRREVHLREKDLCRYQADDFVFEEA